MNRPAIARLLADYGMVFVLLLLCAFFSVVTLSEQHPTSEAAARKLAADLSGRVLIAVRDQAEDAAFADRLAAELKARGVEVVAIVKGDPKAARTALNAVSGRLDAIACSPASAQWLVFSDLPPALGSPRVVKSRAYRWPNFLKADNLLNITNQIAVIAIVAVGMTMVIIAGGIDLSVGSLIALAAVISTLLIRDSAGSLNAGPLGMTLACLAAILVCGGAGAISGTMVTVFKLPPFIVTLAMMLVASGSAYLLTLGQSVYQVPDSFVWLGRGADLFGIPNAVVLMALLYALAHVLMSRMPLGRYIYAVGGNLEAARLSGIRVARVQLFTYTVSGLLAGLGGVIMASQLKSGAPSYGQMYELYVIAAVVVGGASLSGGSGRMFGTLVGAFTIAVIQNGMNLTNVESYTQKVVLGLVILGAVLLDTWRARRGA
ncbi:MAG: ABC transporter permease [Chthoniobacteraceae bacterium]